jgi:3-hydroxyisobutyrate dehydrogenase-like beta-hydroxyacid dehydrogenase
VSAKRVGFIGLGAMGAGMARNIRAAGFDLVVFDLNRGLAEQLLADGAEWAQTPSELAAKAGVVFTSLPEPTAVEAVGSGPNGLIEGMRRGTAWFDLSTNSPSVVRQLNERFAEIGVSVLDSPVSGGPSGANAGTLTLWVSGDREQFDEHADVLSAIGTTVTYLGDVGAASVAKLVHNAAGYAINAVMAEVFSAGVKAGVPPLTLWHAVRDGGLGKVRTFDGLAYYFLPQNFDPPAFALKLAHKDVRLMLELGRDFDVPMRMLSDAHDEMSEGLERGWGGRDSRVSMMLQVERAGLPDESMRCDPEDLRAILQED